MLDSVVQPEVAKWSKLDSKELRTLPGLMQLLQAEERPEADQPEVTAGDITPAEMSSVSLSGRAKGVSSLTKEGIAIIQWVACPSLQVTSVKTVQQFMYAETSMGLRACVPASLWVKKKT